MQTAFVRPGVMLTVVGGSSVTKYKGFLVGVNPMECNTTQHHILVLEDDSSISELLSWILSDAGYQVTRVDTLQGARRACSQFRPDVIIADLLLPDGLGSDLVAEITSRQNGDSPPSIVMSAVPQARYHADAAGADLCLTKPFDLVELLDAISGFTECDSVELQPQ
jgi:DNA-binding response OmpR family regulator